ncbi:T9SS type A sorting domain-containing protein [uncultured Kordia sp.]|uniref:T9SS type A sorting domain-containing protein n=1 Tax=uncultured Kordia sp. TaxID=507699 RepID=UPI00261520C1|nr:T9SS type A sorting domain-containing protein [uncultured Kordia sp.]
MKTQKISTLVLIIIALFSYQANAQDGYTYTLIDNGSYNFTIGAVPNTSSNNFATSVQSYGFTIILPDGVTASITSSLGGAASATFFDGTNVAQPAIDGYLITETLGSPASLTAPSAGTTSNIVTIQINGAPTSGSMYILENNSALATTVTPLKSFMQADMVDNGMAEFVNVVDPNATAVSGMSSFDFSTLSVEETNELATLSIYPNPVKDIIHITNANTDLIKAEIHNLNGQLVLSKENNLSTMNVNGLQSGIYMLKLYSEKAEKTIKLIKN